MKAKIGELESKMKELRTQRESDDEKVNTVKRNGRSFSLKRYRNLQAFQWMVWILFFFQMVHDSKEIQQLKTDKVRLMHEVQRLMQTVEHLENTLTELEGRDASEVNMVMQMLIGFQLSNESSLPMTLVSTLGADWLENFEFAPILIQLGTITFSRPHSAPAVCICAMISAFDCLHLSWLAGMISLFLI